MRAWCLALVALAISGTAGLGGGAQLPQAQFRGGVDVVTLSVTVTDGARRYLTDLAQEDFVVLEDGRRQQLTFFQKTGLPLALAMLLDTSASMEESLAFAQNAAIGFANQLGPADTATVISFDSSVRVLQPFTHDHEAIERAIRHTAAGGSTVLYNAVYIALKELNRTQADDHRTEPRRQAIVLLSDGQDTSSLVAFDEVLEFAARADTVIYGIGLGVRTSPGAARKPDDAQFVLRRLAEQTGGRAFFPQEVKDLTAVYGEIRTELSSQYALAYESDNLRRDGRFRRIAVRVERPGAIARTRPGYYAPTK
jgi:Ca-activated chloride channel family protein